MGITVIQTSSDVSDETTTCLVSRVDSLVRNVSVP
jgi:hypothetical protein